MDSDLFFDDFADIIKAYAEQLRREGRVVARLHTHEERGLFKQLGDRAAHLLGRPYAVFDTGDLTYVILMDWRFHPPVPPP
ncbi:hypothetical protein [Actinomadura rudentiformis]|uniref:Uncharacterized protein n=1 Tax=Actinomadura rudentiformis TaxID=359158 RepID=A0A6H9Z1E8_9ACTN|nr:hypothetical protein [Actinomadura rudentiformis]KAB2350375.1 hypothetical protein F8566_11440 [Actinomadura rudentiformis]